MLQLGGAPGQGWRPRRWRGGAAARSSGALSSLPPQLPSGACQSPSPRWCFRVSTPQAHTCAQGCARAAGRSRPWRREFGRRRRHAAAASAAAAPTAVGRRRPAQLARIPLDVTDDAGSAPVGACAGQERGSAPLLVAAAGRDQRPRRLGMKRGKRSRQRPADRRRRCGSRGPSAAAAPPAHQARQGLSASDSCPRPPPTAPARPVKRRVQRRRRRPVAAAANSRHGARHCCASHAMLAWKHAAQPGVKPMPARQAETAAGRPRRPQPRTTAVRLPAVAAYTPTSCALLHAPHVPQCSTDAPASAAAAALAYVAPSAPQTSSPATAGAGPGAGAPAGAEAWAAATTSSRSSGAATTGVIGHRLQTAVGSRERMAAVGRSTRAGGGSGGGGVGRAMGSRRVSAVAAA